jgi:hypothetical protein
MMAVTGLLKIAKPDHQLVLVLMIPECSPLLQLRLDIGAFIVWLDCLVQGVGGKFSPLAYIARLTFFQARVYFFYDDPPTATNGTKGHLQSGSPPACFPHLNGLNRAVQPFSSSNVSTPLGAFR